MIKAKQIARPDADTARRLFFEQGKDPSHCLPKVIARSWQRCSDRLDNASLPTSERIDTQLLRERREIHERLRHLVEPEMDALAELVADSGSMVLFADADGLILDSAGGLEFLSKAQQVALQPGASWSEHGRGTNAIGTALIEREAIAVRGGQHYLDSNGILSCAAAPIFSARGELLGVLDVSGESEHIHNQALGMVRLATQVIEHRLITESDQPHTLIRFHPNQRLLGSHREGILVIAEDRIVGANRLALKLLDARWKDLLDRPAEEWLRPSTANRSDRHQPMIDTQGRRLHGRIDALQKTQIPVAMQAGAPCKPFLDAQTRQSLHQAQRVLDAGISVLIHGETGVGKEVFARELHAASLRSKAPFVAVNCAALPESLIEAELFGYQGGAFTGANRRGMPGRVREADGGILFLDEIGDMPLALQSRLLRVLQEKAVHPLGGGRSTPVDFALVCATNCDLETSVANGEFRADLYYRIQDFKVQLAPLRERADLGDIVHGMLRGCAQSNPPPTLTQDALDALIAYQWPGNLRQLNSVIRTLVALTDGDQAIDLQGLPADIRQFYEQTPLAKADSDSVEQASIDLRQLSDETIERALAECDGCISDAAARLGIHRSTIYRWRGRRKK